MNRLVSILGITLLSSGLICSCSKTPGEITDNKTYTNEYYTNMLIPKTESGGQYMEETPDPSIVKGDDGYYYIFTTGNGGGKCFRSTDCVNWKLYLNSVIARPTWGDNGGAQPSVWAPDAYKVGDTWIYYYSLSGWGNAIGVGYATSSSIAGPWEDQGKLFTCQEIGVDNAIDPCIIEDNGHLYMVFGSFQGCALVELSEDGMSLKGGAAIQNKEKVLLAGVYGPWNGSAYEGSYIVKKDDYFYYFGSQGTCCEGKNSTYKVVVGRSKDVKGPYVDDKNRPLGGTLGNGKLVVWASMNNENIAGPGHNSVLMDDKGDYWLIYHAYCKRDNFQVRHLFMDKILWDEQGWPYIEGYQPSYGEELLGPSFEVKENTNETK